MTTTEDPLAAAPSGTTSAASAPGTSTTTRRLLLCGALAGPAFVATAAVQVVTRDGFDLRRQPISLLSLGDLGWVQITNFVVAGLLCLGFSLGVRRLGVGRWRPRLLAVFAVGLVAGGGFVPDPGLGFPPGTPDGVPDSLSWHGALHAVAPPLAFLALVLACGAYARRFAAEAQRGWAWVSALAAAGCLLLAGWPDMDGAGIRLAAGTALGFTWVTALAVHLLRQHRSP